MSNDFPPYDYMYDVSCLYNVRSGHSIVAICACCLNRVVRRTYAASWTVASNTRGGAPVTAAVNLHCCMPRQTNKTRVASGALPAVNRGHAPTANADVPVATTK